MKRPIFHLTALLLFVLTALPCLAAPEVRTLTVGEVQTLLQNPPADLIILDVRTSKEFAESHLRKAVNMDFFGPRFDQELRALDKKKPYLVYCRTDSRSGSAVEMMQQEGFKNVILMKGGFVDWTKEDLPTEK